MRLRQRPAIERRRCPAQKCPLGPQPRTAAVREEAVAAVEEVATAWGWVVAVARDLGAVAARAWVAAKVRCAAVAAGWAEAEVDTWAVVARAWAAAGTAWAVGEARDWAAGAGDWGSEGEGCKGRRRRHG